MSETTNQKSFALIIYYKKWTVMMSLKILILRTCYYFDDIIRVVDTDFYKILLEKEP